MKIHSELQQGSWDWITARAGKVCGSELRYLITDKLKIRDWKSEMPNSYLHRKLAEKWRGQALESFSGSRQTDQGVIYEEQARNYFSSFLEADIQTIGGMESADEKCWASPDGIMGEDVGLEIKSPNPENQVGWLLAGTVPEEHVLQVQFGLWVSGFKHWWFLAYCKDFPHLAISVDPNEEISDLISEVVEDFNARLDAAFSKLVELNGGPPPKRRVFVPTPPEPGDMDYNDRPDINP